jgi:hypothetical protein
VKGVTRLVGEREKKKESVVRGRKKWTFQRGPGHVLFFGLVVCFQRWTNGGGEGSFEQFLLSSFLTKRNNRSFQFTQHTFFQSSQGVFHHVDFTETTILCDNVYSGH